MRKLICDCGETALIAFPLFWERKEALENVELLSNIVKAIYRFYPGAVIRAFFDHPEYCIVHFNALGVYGSDSVCIRSNGEWYQWMSGDLNLITLDKLEKHLKVICASYHQKIVESKISEGMKKLFA